MIKGIIGRKVGMTQIFAENGTSEGVTVVQAGPCLVTEIRTPERNGYTAVQLGFEELRDRMERKLNQPEKGYLRKKKLPLMRYLREVQADDVTGLTVGDRVDVSMFAAGDLVDVTGTSKGKGFAGVVKRHHFAGGPKTHGASDRLRRPGSIGAGTTPGRVLKGLRMPGHMGHEHVTVQNLRVLRVDAERNLLIIRGAIPGPSDGLLMVSKAVKVNGK
jgi:large subunit ribosomal protein L3